MMQVMIPNSRNYFWRRLRLQLRWDGNVRAAICGNGSTSKNVKNSVTQNQRAIRHEYRETAVKNQESKRTHARRYAEVHGIAALLHFACGEWLYCPGAGYVG